MTEGTVTVMLSDGPVRFTTGEPHYTLDRFNNVVIWKTRDGVKAVVARVASGEWAWVTDDGMPE